MGTRSKSWYDFLEMASQMDLRNLVDVGYGVSQSLPVLTELLSDNAPSTYLLQQPEVHLHPTAQAALGSLFCNIAAKGVQMLVETHSDYLLDRIRMDVRDGKGEPTLKPEDVSILYFERFWGKRSHLPNLDRRKRQRQRRPKLLRRVLYV